MYFPSTISQQVEVPAGQNKLHIDYAGNVNPIINTGLTLTQNLPGVRWSKLAINCAVSTLGTLGGERVGSLLRLRFVRRLALEVVTEAVQLARAEGVQLEKVSGTVDLDWLALAEGERVRGSMSLATKHALLLAVGARYRRMR